MKGNNTLLLHLFYTLFLFLVVSKSSARNSINDDTDRNQVYIVYMGAADSTNASLRNDHDRILNLVLRRNGNALVRRYKHGFSGFAARLSKEDAALIAKKPGVVSVFPDPILELYTTRSWDFLQNQIRVISDTKPNTVSNFSSSSDIVIGIIDSGIWPEAPSFSDEGFGPVPSSWNGTCMKSKDFVSSHCNRKIIGARYYTDQDESREGKTVRDMFGHGTHVASTAVGAVVSDVSYYGLAEGTARGGSPQSRLAVYKVCEANGCAGSMILAAFDDAIADGVHVLSLSLGFPAGVRSHLAEDIIAIGAFHAVARGIVVVCAAGNSGPEPFTVNNDAPWILTVAASTIDRDLQSNVVLGNNVTVKGRAINFSPLSKTPEYPIIYAESAAKASKHVSLDDARQCLGSSLNRTKVQGKIVVCEGGINSEFPTIAKIYEINRLGGIGLVHISDDEGSVAFDYGDFPATVVRSKDGPTILQYINSTSNPVATVLATETVRDYKPAPVVPNFSSRGPSAISTNILKPDITAPGVNIIAAWTGRSKEEVPKGRKRSLYNIISGTSMACPHASGLATSVKAHNPTWSVSAIKSAIMTTAIQNDNLKGSITTDSYEIATPYDYGAGDVTISEPLQPGLVYETSTIDYLNFLCYTGLNLTSVKLIAGAVPGNFSCPEDSSSDLISNINYPSIAVNFTGKESVNVTRTVTNVGEEDETVYTYAVVAPSGVDVKLIPEELQFTKDTKKLSYQVIFSTSTTLKKDLFGSITWSNGHYRVRSPFVLTTY